MKIVRYFGVIITLLMSIATLAAVKDSKHNLSSTGTFNATDGTAEVCVFCHTPHGASETNDVPLWNKALPDGAGFQSYSSSTIDGGIAAVGSVSIACLSCHDGSQAMDVMINAPGSGGYNATGARLAGTWTGTTVNGTSGVMLNTGDRISAVGKDNDLTNDHPISIQYGGGGITSTSTDTRDADFNSTATSVINGTSVWWVDVDTATVGGSPVTGTALLREKTDMILYTRIESSLANEPEPFVECASCHDPHQSNTSTFLRIDNSGSAVCMACHVK